MCNLTREKNLREIDDWLNDYLNYIYDKIPIILVGYITDDEAKIPYNEIRRIAKLNELAGYAICNLQTRENLEEIFKALIKILLKKEKKSS